MKLKDEQPKVQDVKAPEEAKPEEAAPETVTPKPEADVLSALLDSARKNVKCQRTRSGLNNLEPVSCYMFGPPIARAGSAMFQQRAKRELGPRLLRNHHEEE
ncbi:MAG: hypothetical protein ABSH32_25555, partial [Bryobacteraceae bacterium]